MHNIFNKEIVSFPQYAGSVAKLMMWYIQKFFSGSNVVFIWAARTCDRKFNLVGYGF